MIVRTLRAATPGARAALVLLACGALAACAPPTGDFGRAEPSVVHDRLMPAFGREAARQRGEPVSYYRMTDAERTMRNIGWGVVMPPLPEQWRERTLVELRRTRVLPAERARVHKESYVRTLLAIDYRSSGARYARLIDDVRADTDRIEPFFAAAAKVAEDDRVRARTANRVPELTPDEAANVDGRIAENGLMIAWVRQSFEERLIAYRYALDRLVLETPDRKALEAEEAIATFASVLASLRPLGPAKGVFKG
ncbi:hypothetical protein GCM10008171_17100 [Methylopila jiangsuensis]|uniref:Uncharacterized protein n=1 Tax=Methylopila jiangsuensis TaxID=586230 RepID=A0A9W6JF53_9HYPH|nr:hypothetical protein [Methylopila jiangsuensis]MDR6284031.1 hypothetical protein [Methylopila jiangsuensis]GLK76456.1 hypothetical protein GCM10008171_17100 [Methylopila jiangsuensis]